LEIEKFQLQRIIEDLAESFDKVAYVIDGNYHFLPMNLCREHDSC
jgi:hypothetical protein